MRDTNSTILRLLAVYLTLLFVLNENFASADDTPSFLRTSKLGEKIDFLKAVDPEKDIRGQSWTLGEDGLVSSRSGLTLVTMSQKLPDNYVLYARLKRVERNDSLGICLPVGASATVLMFNFAGGKSSGFYYLDGVKPGSEENETRTDKNMISDNRFSDIVIAVMNNHVIVTVDGKPHIDWTGDPSRLSTEDWNGMKNNGQLMLGTYYSSWRVSRLEMQPILEVGLPEAIVRFPVPDEESIEEAKPELEMKLGFSLRASGFVQGQALNQKLFDALLGESNKVYRYILLTEAADLSAKVGDLEKSWEAVDLLAKDYEVNALDLKQDSLKTIASSKAYQPPYYVLSLKCFQLAETILDQHQYERARSFLKTAIDFAKNSQSSSLIAQLRETDDQWKDWGDAYEDIQEQHQTYLQNSSDTKAAEVWGRFLCLQRQKWMEGLPLLAQGSNSLADVAKLEIGAKLDFEKSLELMNAWEKVRGDFTKAEETALQDHAYDIGENAYLYVKEEQEQLLEEKITQRFGRTRIWQTSEEGTGVELGHSRANIGVEGTVELWLRTTDQDGCVIKKRLDSGESTIGLRIQDGKVAYYAQGYNYSRFQYSEQRVDDGLWHHLALVKQGGYLTLFIDGQKELVVNEIRPALKSKANWHLGYSRVDSRLPLKAKYARIRVSGVARYHVNFEPQDQYSSDRATLFLE